MPTWPNTLPNSPLLNAFEENVPDTRLRTQMDAGPAKMRRRTTSTIRDISVEYLLHKNDITVLEGFFFDDLNGGTDQFDYTHPRTGNTISCRFVTPPVYTPTNGIYFNARFKLEIMP